jgi:hypothetical protein
VDEVVTAMRNPLYLYGFPHCGLIGSAGKIARLVASNWQNNAICCPTSLDAASDRSAGNGPMSTNPHARGTFSCATSTIMRSKSTAGPQEASFGRSAWPRRLPHNHHRPMTFTELISEIGLREKSFFTGKSAPPGDRDPIRTLTTAITSRPGRAFSAFGYCPPLDGKRERNARPQPADHCGGALSWTTHILFNSRARAGNPTRQPNGPVEESTQGVAAISVQTRDDNHQNGRSRRASR